MRNPEMMGLLLGGVLPAIVYGLANVFSKASSETGIGIGPYLFSAGCAILFVGALCWIVLPDRSFSLSGISYAAGLGLCWGIGTAFVALGLLSYGAPISKLAPLFNMNTIVSVALALWIFAEWQTVRVPQLLMGAILIVLGGTLVARS